MKPRILLIEDDEGLFELVKAHVEHLGYELDWASDGESGLERALAADHSLILLDVALPRLGGTEVCKRIRERKPLVPIIMISSRGEELDKVLGLTVGADDYLTKPFSASELSARIAAKTRIARLVTERTAAKERESSKLLIYGPLVVDLLRMKATIGGEDIVLTAREFELLAFLAENPGKPLSRETILREVWGLDNNLDYGTNINVIINRIRSKIEPNPESPQFIKTVWGFGYRFVELHELP